MNKLVNENIKNEKWKTQNKKLIKNKKILIEFYLMLIKRI